MFCILYLQIDKEYIGIYQYNSHDDMEKDAKLIGWHGTSTGYAEISWVSKPHFYKKGSIIVLYVGENQEIIMNLRKIMGSQFAGQ